MHRATKVPGATKIEELEDAPGGGYFVTLTDPEGFPINLMYGQKPAERGPMPEILTTNYELEKPRVAKFQRFKPGPAAVHKVRPVYQLFHSTLISLFSSLATTASASKTFTPF